MKDAALVPSALVCDLDGVIRSYDPKQQAQVEERHGLPPGMIAAAAFTSEVLSDAVTGRVQDQVWRDAVARDLASQHGEAAIAAVHEWSLVDAEPSQQVLALLREVRSRAPVVVLTNATSRLHEDLERLGLAPEVDAIVSSADIGVAKPHPAAFAAAAQAASRVLGRDLAAGQLAFVDDTVGHVHAAARLGWRAHAFIDAGMLRAFLLDCGLLGGTTCEAPRP